MKEKDPLDSLKSLRERLGLTQEQFVREVGVTFSTVNLRETSPRRPQPYLMNRPWEMEASLKLEQPRGKKREERSRRGHRET